MKSWGARALLGGDTWVPLVCALVTVQLAGCRPALPLPPVRTEPAKIELIEGTDLHRVTLSARAAERLGIQTEVVSGPAVISRKGAVETPDSGVARTRIPYSALIYDARGNPWTYTAPQPLTFVRELVRVDYIEGGIAFLSEGPPTDTAVVTVGAPELFGAEFGVGH